MLLAACIVGSEYIVVSTLCRYICFRYMNALHLPDFSWTGNFQESNLSCLKLRLEDFILLSDKVPSLPIFNTHIFSEWNFVSPVSLSWSVFWISRLLWVVFPWPHDSNSVGASAPVILVEGCSDRLFKESRIKIERTLSLSQFQSSMLYFRMNNFIYHTNSWTIVPMDGVYHTKMSSLKL